jgi:hypothetical protein
MNFHEEIKSRRQIARNEMRRLQWDWLPEGQATGQTGSQNLSRAVQGMRGQGAAHAH